MYAINIRIRTHKRNKFTCETLYYGYLYNTRILMLLQTTHYTETFQRNIYQISKCKRNRNECEHKQENKNSLIVRDNGVIIHDSCYGSITTTTCIRLLICICILIHILFFSFFFILMHVF